MRYVVIIIRLLCVSVGYKRFRKASFTVCYGVLKTGLNSACVCVCVRACVGGWVGVRACLL